MKRVLLLLLIVYNFQLNYCNFVRGRQIKPPVPKYGYDSEPASRRLHIREKIKNLEKNDNPWEHSGLYQGDIMIYSEGGYQRNSDAQRNGILNHKSYWSNGIVPFYVEEEDFSDDDIKEIMLAIQEYHKKTCIKFRPYREKDKNWIIVRGNDAGCWSSVGMKSEGQILHLQTPGCVHRGTIIHEFLHALGFFHQQSASNRDEYVEIHWENITPGKESNFKKYDNKTITDYAVEYDYSSVMHYSGKAFSKNKMDTIVSLQPNTTLGQRKGFSERDLIKLQKMYQSTCDQRELSAYEDETDAFYDIFENFFY